jgi:hypothetical protein
VSSFKYTQYNSDWVTAGEVPQYRLEVYSEANCGGTVHLFHRALITGVVDTGWVDITPASVTIGQTLVPVSIGTSPTTPTNGGIMGWDLNVVLTDTSGNLLHGRAALGSLTDPGTYSWSGVAGIDVKPTQKGRPYDIWTGDLTVVDFFTTGQTLMVTEHLRAFSTNTAGRIEYRDWTKATGWGPAVIWFAPTTPCSSSEAPVASIDEVTRGDTNMVGCIDRNQVLHAAYGIDSIDVYGTAWYQLAGGAYGATLLEPNGT